MTTEEMQQMLDLYEAQFNSAWTHMVHGRLGDTIATGSGPILTMVWRSFGKVAYDPDTKQVPVEVLLTEDGGTADTRTWHKGEPTGESVYAERWDAEHGRYWHGYVDPTSREVVQTG